MTSLPIPKTTRRELWLTPAVLRFLQYWGHTETGKQLTEYIVRALDGRQEKNGYTMFTGLTFLLYIADPEDLGKYDRVVVWHVPSDGGTHFSESLLGKASPYGVDFA